MRVQERTPATWIPRLATAALALLVVLAPAIAQAQAVIKVNDNVNIKFGIQLQAWADWTQDTATSGYAENLYLRRARFLVSGQVAPDVSFFFCTDNPNLGKAPKALGAGFIIQDALVTWKIAKDFVMLDGGYFLVPLSRHGLQSTLSYLTLDLSGTASVFAAPSGTGGLRDTGFGLRGYLLNDRLEYRADVFQGLRTAAVAGKDAGSRNTLRTSAYLEYDFFGTEKGYVHSGTNLGKKKVLALSGGYDGQDNYHAYSGNVFTTLPVAKGDELAGQVQWVHYDGENFNAGIPRQNDYLAELAYYVSAGKVQPFAKYELQKFSDTLAAGVASKDVKRYGGGLNFNVSAQNFKITAQYLRVKPDNSAIAATNQFTIQLQAFYF